MTNRQPVSPKFREMTGRQKLIHVLKVVVCALSFGFIFPNINLD